VFLMRRPKIFLLAAALAVVGLASGQPRALEGPPPARAATTVELCGTVSLYLKPTVLTPGAVTVGLVPFVLMPGTSVPSSVQVGANLCLRLTLNLTGSITNLVVIGADTTITVKICGDVTAYTAATTLTAGSLKIAGRTFQVAQGTSLPAAVKVGADVCATLSLNLLGQVKNGVVTANTTVLVEVCGDVSAYTAATLTSTGLLKIGSHTYTTGLGTTLPAAVKAGADLCATLELNLFGQVKGGTVVANVTVDLEVCGQVTAYVAATSTTAGSLTVAGLTKAIAPGTSVSAAVKVGAYVKLRLEIDVFARVSKVTVLKVGASLADACGTITPPPGTTPPPGATSTPGTTPPPGATSTPSPTAAPSGTPNPSAGPTSTPSSSSSPGPSGSPSASSTPSPSGTPAGTSSPSATPTGGTEGEVGSTPAPSLAPGAVAGEQCPPAGASSISANVSAPQLPEDETPIRRAGQILATAAMPFGLFLAGMAAMSFIRRRNGAQPEDEMAPDLHEIV
jgi:hypothetical protein